MLIYFIPFISALIGWLTNKVALKMLFYPKKPILGIQGLIPKRKEKLAKKIGDVVEKELLSLDDLLQKIDKEKIYSILREKIENVIEKKLPFLHSLIPDEVKEHIINEIIGNILFEIKKVDDISEIVSISSVVENKINNFDIFKLETIIKEVGKREFISIEICGAILGFIIGIIQILLFTLN